MKTPTLLKVLTISIFVILIAVFVFYRSGALSDGNLIVKKKVDTNYTGFSSKRDTVPAAFRDSVLKEMSKETFSSSKSIIVVSADQPHIRKIIDSLWKKHNQSRKGEGKFRLKKEFMPGSKSAPMVSPGNSIKDTGSTKQGKKQ